MRELKFLCYIIIAILLIGSFSVVGIDQKSILMKNVNRNDFYFVQLTDTHIKHKIIDFKERTTNQLRTVIEKINSFDNPPAFVVITGDLCEWAGSDPLGALNCKAFVSCFYKDGNQLYLDSELTIPVYTTPGNHDYVITRNLKNYHKYIDKNHLEEEDRYNITYGDVTLYFMDSGPNYYSDPKIIFEWWGEGLYDEDIEWLDNQLSICKTSKKIVLMHHPAVGESGPLFVRNREEFIELCESYDVEVVLAGHTHIDRIYDSNINKYKERPLNCSNYTTLYVQSDDCKQGIHYRNISIIGNDIWLESSIELNIEKNTLKNEIDIKNKDFYRELLSYNSKNI